MPRFRPIAPALCRLLTPCRPVCFSATADDDRRARLALRYILGNPAITAPIPGLVNLHQVDNAVQAVKERRKLDLKERAELDQAGRRMWARLRPGYEWLRQWREV